MRVSVVVPALNEANVLPTTLPALRAQNPSEILVVDGGSADATRDVARRLGAAVHEAPQGRAAQMNYGARQAQGDALLFLHADTRLPPNGLARIRDALARPGVEAGTFRLSFDTPTPLLRFYAWCTRWPWIRLCFGDRGLFVEREAFAAVGGYPDWPIFEDLELAARLHMRGGFRFLPDAVTTSARRFRKNGTVRQQLHNLYLWLHYICGADPERVAPLYGYDQPSRPSEADAPPRATPTGSSDA